MKLYELINEAPKKDQFAAKSFFDDERGAKPIVLKHGKQVASFIKQKCAPWLKETQNGKRVLYRGFRHIDIPMAFTKKVRKRRDPKDSPKEKHNAFNLMIKKCGKKANRTNSLFATGDKYDAEEYGVTYIIFPIGNFAYTWHEDHRDWHGDVPYEEILLKKAPEITKKKMKAKEKEWTEDWEEINTHSKKELEKSKEYIKSQFAKLGIAVKPSQFTSIGNNLSYIFDSELGTMAAGSSKKPFRYAKKGQKPTFQYYPWTDTHPIQSKIFKTLYDMIVKSDEKKKREIRKVLMAARNKMESYRVAHRWLERYPSVAQYINHEKERELSANIHKLSFKVGKDKPSQVDMDILGQWCKDLKGDDGTLIKAINSENEVMVACDTVLGVDPGFYERVVFPLLNGRAPNVTEQEAQYILQGKDPDDWL